MPPLLSLDFTNDSTHSDRATNWTGDTPITEILTYNQAGNIEQIDREHGSYTLGYDQVDQIVSSVSSGTGSFVPYNRTFGYNLTNDRIADSLNGTGTYISNFLTQNAIASYVADPNGFGDVVRETIGSSIKNYSYRADGRLAGFSSGSLEVAYHYDGLGRRVAKTISDGTQSYTQSFLYLGEENRVLQAKAGDESITTYIDGNGIDEHLGEVKNGIGKAYVTDHLGSVLNGEAAGTSHSFGQFGEVATNPVLSPSSNPIYYAHGGRIWDSESQTIDHRRRQRNPYTGLFMQQEPTGRDGPNLYWGLKNNAVRYVDPDGLKAAESFGGGYGPVQGYVDTNFTFGFMTVGYVSGFYNGSQSGCTYPYIGVNSSKPIGGGVNFTSSGPQSGTNGSFELSFGFGQYTYSFTAESGELNFGLFFPGIGLNYTRSLDPIAPNKGQR